VGHDHGVANAASHPFYRRLNQLLREHAFDDFVEGQRAAFYAERTTVTRVVIAPSLCNSATAGVTKTSNLIWNDLLSSRLFSKLGWPSAPQASAYWHTRILVRE